MFSLKMLYLYFWIVPKKYIQKCMYEVCACVSVSTHMFIATNVGEIWCQLFCVLLLLLLLYGFPCGVWFYAVALPPPNYAKQSVTYNDVNHKWTKMTFLRCIVLFNMLKQFLILF